MRTTIHFSSALIALLLTQNIFACIAPDEITIPNGSAASAEEMTTAGQTVHQYMINMQRYQVCLEDEASLESGRSGNDSKSQAEERENRYVAMHNAASDAMTETAERFRQAVTDYEARQ